MLQHLAGKKSDNPKRTTNLTEYHYPGVETYKFATPFHASFHYTTEALSHTRSLTHLKPRLEGPYFDLEVIWDEHCYYEFADRSVEHTMSTMVQEPYVNHVPTVSSLSSHIIIDSVPNHVIAHRRRRSQCTNRLLPAQLHLQQLCRYRPRAD